jgi:hypothetical protein
MSRSGDVPVAISFESGAIYPPGEIDQSSVGEYYLTGDGYLAADIEPSDGEDVDVEQVLVLEAG